VIFRTFLRTDSRESSNILPNSPGAPEGQEPKFNTFSLLPAPLYTPEKWPLVGGGTRVWDSVWIIPLDVVCFAGGPLKDYFETIQKKSTFAWFVPKNFLTASLASEKSLHSVELKLRAEFAEEVILEAPGKGLVFESESPEAFQKRLPSLAQFPVLATGRSDLAKGAGAWAEAIFSVFWQAVGDERAADLLNDYAQEFPEVDDFPWEGLRFFAGFIRQSGDDSGKAAELAARDWAKFQALFSVQDENSERSTLDKNEIMFNPTAQILQRVVGADPDLSVMIREGAGVIEISLTWMDAALIDTVNEEARVDRAKLLAIVEKDHGGSFAPALDRLIESRILLEGL
jgi:hypothetical protein